MPVTESVLVYARMGELVSKLPDPAALSELRRLCAVHRWEGERLPAWVREEIGLVQGDLDGHVPIAS